MSARAATAALLAAALVYPLLFFGDGAWLVRSNYAIDVGMLALFAAFLGQSWNVAGGFAGLTSFGHVLFFGTGAYCSTILHVGHGVNPWFGWVAATTAGAALGAAVGHLTFRVGLRGSYFALITLAFAETFRVLANSVGFTRGGLGILIPLDQRAAALQFHDPIWFYYLALALCASGLAIAWWLTRSRFGTYLAAIRENEDAARALGIDVVRQKVRCLALSGAMAAAGGTFYAQKYLYIDPSIAFGVDRSVEMLLVAMIGGAGTVFGPLVGAGAVVALGEATRALSDARGLGLILYGLLLVAIVGFLPNGLVGLVRAARRDA
ncbi:MAG: branched-chain amino acid ABC transporter permease [Alphaproteobacteria bacterium]|nr:branched-chain amino acid ABC transporter permease [Alphaproteobacteria bacterium]